MNLTTKLKKKGNQLEKLLKQVRNLNKESVQVGHFRESGKHPSGFTYPELMAIHHAGNPETNLPARPVLDILFFRNRRLTANAIDMAFKAWGKRKLNASSNKKLLSDLGMYIRDEEKKIFGSSVLAPNAVPPKSFNSPLVDTGELKSKVAYKTSLDKKVKEG